jgi:predicted aldo/keto reductase-like oxidoreductase
VNYFDTAWVYHNDRSEDFVGRFLSSKPRDSFFVATKLPCWLVKKPADAERIFAEQLRRLRVDRIDFYSCTP